MAFLGWGHRSTPSKESSCSSCSVFPSPPLLDGTELNNECSNDCATRVCIVSDQTARERFLSFFFFFSSLSSESKFRIRFRRGDGNEHEKIFQIFSPISFDDVERPPRYNDKERATTTIKKTRNVNTNKKEKRGARKTKQRKGRRTS